LTYPGSTKCSTFDGFRVLEWLGRFSQEIPVIVVTAQEGTEIRKRALEANALVFMEKPVEGQRLVDAVQIALEDEYLSGTATALSA
jgi:FixJ family two-component response regulator